MANHWSITGCHAGAQMSQAGECQSAYFCIREDTFANMGPPDEIQVSKCLHLCTSPSFSLTRKGFGSELIQSRNGILHFEVTETYTWYEDSQGNERNIDGYVHSLCKKWYILNITSNPIRLWHVDTATDTITFPLLLHWFVGLLRNSISLPKVCSPPLI